MPITDATAIILCGGYGKRLQEITGPDFPKCMVDVNGKPFLERQIEWIAGFGITHFILAVAHGREVIQKHFGIKWSPSWDLVRPVSFDYSIERPRATGIEPAVEQARGLAGLKDFAVFNGDTWWPSLNLEAKWDLFSRSTALKAALHADYLHAGITFYKYAYFLKQEMNIDIPDFMDIGAPESYREFLDYWTNNE